jgi:hypothetical protein
MVAKVDSDPYALQYMPGGGAGAKTAVGLSQGAALRRADRGGIGGIISTYATPRSAARLGHRRMVPSSLGGTVTPHGVGGVGGSLSTSILTSPEVNPELNTDMLVSRRNLRRLGALEAPPEVRIASASNNNNNSHLNDSVTLGAPPRSLEHAQHAPNVPATPDPINTTIRRDAKYATPANGHGLTGASPAQATPQRTSQTAPLITPAATVGGGNGDIGHRPPATNPELQRRPTAPVNDTDDNDYYNNNNSQPLPLTLTNDEYQCDPPYSKLRLMSQDELSRVPGFTVSHEKYGSITWLGDIDIRGIHIDALVVFGPQSCEVYPGDTHKPSHGKQLNRPADITLYECWPSGGPNVDSKRLAKYENKLREYAATNNATFINYDRRRGHWTFNVGGF